MVRLHTRSVLAVCLAHTSSRADAEDVMQDVFLKALIKSNTLRDSAKTRSWLLQIARRTCIDHRRRKKPTVPLQSDLAQAPSDACTVRFEPLHRALSRLPRHYRETVSLYYLDGRSCPAVAQNLGISAAAVRRRLVRARLLLHKILTEDQT